MVVLVMIVVDVLTGELIDIEAEIGGQTLLGHRCGEANVICPLRWTQNPYQIGLKGLKPLSVNIYREALAAER